MAWSDDISVGTPTYQIAASLNSRIRVVAGPGTGKSFALQRRVARLLETHVAPAEILPVTFTRVAAEDLHRELVNMNVAGCDELQGRTLHSLALRVLMRNHVLNVTGRNPRPLNEFELEPLVCDLMGTHGGKRSVKKLRMAYEAAWARLQHQQPGYAPSPADAAFQADLLAWLTFHEAMLIGEVIPQLHDYLYSNPAARERHEYSHIVVDEYQDLNRAEQAVIELLSNSADVCIVGDDDQSIYSFKHAHPDGIRVWLNSNPGAEDLTLTDCHRCPTRVVEMANSLISHNVFRPVPRLNPLAANGEGDIGIFQYPSIAREIEGVATIVAQLTANGTPPGDILVLAQGRVFGTPLYEALIANGIPTKSYYMESELNQTESQRAFALLKLLVNRNDRVALRWLVGLNGNNWHAAGYRRVREHCETTGMSPWDTLSQLENEILHLPYTGGIASSFREIVQEIIALEALPNLGAVIDYLFPEGQEATRDIRGLAVATLSGMINEDREEFINQLSTSISQPEIPTEVEEVRIMSLHKQRRLFYVGITRTKAVPSEQKQGTLLLTYSQEMPLGDALSANIVPAGQRYGSALLRGSQFIRELGPSAPVPIVG